MQPAGINWKGRFALNGGWGWRTNKIEPNLTAFQRDYLKDLRSGYGFGGEGEYYFSDIYGAGVQFNLFSSSASVPASAQISPGVFVNGILSDDISIFYIGPKFCMRFPSQTKMNAFLMGFSIGYLGYSDIGGFGTTTGAVKGSTVGVVYDAGYDIGVTKHFALGVNISWVLGALSSYDVTSGGTTTTVKLDKDHLEGLSHFDLGFGVRLR